MCARIKIVFSIACLATLVPAGLAAPALTTSALAVRVLYDDNVFLQDNAPLAPGQTAAALPARGGAFSTTLGASLGLTWKPGSETKIESSYAPEVSRYSSYQSENHTDHRFTVNATGAAGDWRYETKANWLSTTGAHESPVFNRLGGSPPIGSEPVRARRAQEIAKATGRVTRSWNGGFVRGVFAVNDQDFHTRQSSAAGYANYVDRGEWTAGVDLGWKLRPDLSLLTAIRQGRQHQADLLGVPLNYTNTLTRWLVGAEGQVTKTFKLNLLAGPDVRHFGAAVRPGYDRSQTATYWEAGATWTPAKTDVLTLSGRHYLWVSSGGRGVYLDTVYDLSWKHQFTPAWNLTTGLNQHTGYTGRYNPTAPRHDVVRAVTGTLTRVIDAKTKLELGLAQDWADSLVPNTPGREYRRRICTVGCSRLW
jgi:hypothetical protein